MVESGHEAELSCSGGWLRATWLSLLQSWVPTCSPASVPLAVRVTLQTQSSKGLSLYFAVVLFNAYSAYLQACASVQAYLRP